ncbi:DNA gyrase subunit B [Geodia barretti]|uniref:DNA gyrase subunit B n=1 Tax=Geodia barretti TaxID=519541 RepID=A0AA35S9P9_GEOBA|nr:DNA gyrase subunit B [Geodia barretti]
MRRCRRARRAIEALQRYKGLGEMNADQLWDTTMNPETRKMLRVSAHDLAEAHDVFEMLMGEQVGPRKNFIQSHATECATWTFRNPFLRPGGRMATAPTDDMVLLLSEAELRAVVAQLAGNVDRDYADVGWCWSAC